MDRITNLQTRISHKKKRYFKNIVYPHVPIEFDDVYVITVVGDRLDNLAFTFYNDTSLWWVIAKANPDIKPIKAILNNKRKVFLKSFFSSNL